MTQKKYPKLRKENLEAASEIALVLKDEKAMSEATFANIFANCRGIIHRGGSFHHLMDTTKEFLMAHGVATFHQINGLNLWIATQKCVRTKLENMFVEYQYVTNANIDLAIIYQNTNGGLVPAEIEGKVIAKNILGLTGKVAENFIKDYVSHKSYFTEFNEMDRAPKGTPLRPGRFEMKMAILTVIRNTPAIKKI